MDTKDKAIFDHASEAKARALAMAARLEVMAKGLEQAGLIMQAKANRKKAAEIREANK